MRVKLQQLCKRVTGDPEYDKPYQLDFLMCNPMGIIIFKGPNLVVDFANELVLQLWRRNVSDVIGKPLRWALPKAHHFDFHLTKVFTSGKYCYLEKMPIQLFNGNKLHTAFVNCWMDVITASNDDIIGVIAVISEITEFQNK